MLYLLKFMGPRLISATTDVPKAQSSFPVRQQLQDPKLPNSTSIIYIDGLDYLNESSVTEIHGSHPTSVVPSPKNLGSNRTSPQHSTLKQTDYRNGKTSGSNNTSD